ncbi:MAG TPA: hypothetical protein VIF84_10685 [Candidatus Limnocylindrales bacterium]|jgi:hypothetical protein
MNVPGFLAKRFYVAGSLRNTASGFSLQAQNPMGSGTLVGIGRLSVDGEAIPVEAVSAVRDGDPTPLLASEVSPRRPIRVVVGDRITLSIAGRTLSPGRHKLDVELVEVDIGRLKFSISDDLAAGA